MPFEILINNFEKFYFTLKLIQFYLFFGSTYFFVLKLKKKKIKDSIKMCISFLIGEDFFRLKKVGKMLNTNDFNKRFKSFT